MSKTRVEQKATLMKEAEAVIDELLDWQEKAEHPNFSQIEEEVLKLREKLSRQMVSVTLSGEADSTPEVVCPKCEGRMHYKGRKEKRVGSWVGEVKYERAYYHCEKCGQGFFPPGSTA